MYISSLFSLVCIALSAPLCCCVLIEDYATVANADNFLHSRSKPRFFGSTFDYVHTLVDGSVRMYNIIGGGNIVGELIPFALPRSSNLSTVSYFQKVTSDASKMSAINVAVRQSSSGATLPDEYVFGSQLALVWTWDISLNGQDSGWTVQATLATDSVYTFVIYSYCARDFGKLKELNPQIGISKGLKPVIGFPSSVLEASGFLGQDNRNVVRQFVFRIDQITCTQDTNFYCIKDYPKKFSVVNGSITATSANLQFMESLHMNMSSLSAYNIVYSVTCTNDNGVKKAELTTEDRAEMKVFTLTRLTPNTEYTCVLQKRVNELDFTAERKEVIFRTNTIRPNVAPTGVSVDVADESDLVKVSWDPIPFSNDFGDITYQIKLQSPNGPPIVVITPDTRKAIDGLKRQTTYTLTVAAINSMGSGPSSAEVAFSISQPTPKPEPTYASVLPSKTSTTTSASSSVDSTPLVVVNPVTTDATITESPTAHPTEPGHVGVTTDSDQTTNIPSFTTSHRDGSLHITTTATESETTARPTSEKTVVPSDGLTTREVAVFPLLSSEIAAIVLGGIYGISLIIILILVAIICAYRRHKKRKTYIVNRSSASQDERVPV